MSKVINFRVSDDRYEELKRRAGKSKMSEYLMDFLFNEQSVRQPVIHEDWIKLIDALEENFLDKLAQKSGSRDKVVRWAYYLTSLLEGKSVSQETVKNQFHRGWQVESTGYNDEGIEAKWINKNGMRKVIIKGEPGYEEFEDQVGKDER
jgi:hypothetical protein